MHGTHARGDRADRITSAQSGMLDSLRTHANRTAEAAMKYAGDAYDLDRVRTASTEAVRLPRETPARRYARPTISHALELRYERHL